jgi:hypothetical protein
VRKIRLAGLFVLVCLASAAVAQSPSVTPTPCAELLADIREFTHYEASLGTSVILVVPKRPSTACLVDFATKFHEEYPKQNFEIFDASGPELAQYVRWAANGMHDEDPYPEQWLLKHQFATLQPMSDGEPCGHWYLYDGNMAAVKRYERIKCRWETP